MRWILALLPALLLLAAPAIADPPAPDDEPTPAEEPGDTELPDVCCMTPPSVIEPTINAHEPFKVCFREARERGEITGGRKVWMRLLVQPDGSVGEASVLTEDLQGTELDTCLSTAAEEVVFPVHGLLTEPREIKVPFVTKP